eukprot:TRINITY_DN1864_c0_g2_i1.p1 TRINITY_DN1864_c0_g2~~TRINITY_DN1864_c0_g2_i1.p1  ORF type:complete len:391 (+),score=148.86 TRINITY_DN1864_c0_g2_i1:60-1232(+)
MESEAASAAASGEEHKGEAPKPAVEVARFRQLLASCNAAAETKQKASEEQQPAAESEVKLQSPAAATEVAVQEPAAVELLTSEQELQSDAQKEAQSPPAATGQQPGTGSKAELQPAASSQAELQPAATSEAELQTAATHEAAEALDAFLQTDPGSPSVVCAATGDWPEAAVVTESPKAASSGSSSWPEAAQASPGSEAKGGYGSASSSSSGPVPGSGEKPTPAGVRRFIADLSQQLEEEVRRREMEEEELERRAAEKRRLLEELEAQTRRRDTLTAEQRADEISAAEIERQHAGLAEEHQALRAEVAHQEQELEKLREDARARNGAGRDWARDGPEKDALVETKLLIAEAHDELAQLRQQLWLNREGLKKKLSDLQAENMRLRTGRSPVA